jgi:hypothetical protein
LAAGNGTVLERYEYDAYGNPYVLEPNFADDPDGKTDWANPYYFTGRRADFLDGGKLKLQINRHRYYDYYTGRWLSHDAKRIVPNEWVLRPDWVSGESLGSGQYCAEWRPDLEAGMWWKEGETISIWEPLHQYDEAMNLYEYGLSDPVHQLDPMGKGCNVSYKCGLFGSRNFAWGCLKMCQYVCIEDKSKTRKQKGGLPPLCWDPRIPETIYHSKTVLRCSKCPAAVNTNRLWMELQFDWKDCSTKDCIAKAKADASRMKLVCKLFKGKKKNACEKLAESIEATRIGLCSLCKKP